MLNVYCWIDFLNNMQNIWLKNFNFHILTQILLLYSVKFPFKISLNIERGLIFDKTGINGSVKTWQTKIKLQQKTRDTFLVVTLFLLETSRSNLARVKEKSWFSQSTWMMSLNSPILMITVKNFKHIKSTSYILTCKYFSFNKLLCCIINKPMSQELWDSWMITLLRNHPAPIPLLSWPFKWWVGILVHV